MSSIQVVNGYVCQSCSDVSLAKKGVNPAHPQDDPSSPNYNAAAAKADKAKETGAVTSSVVFGGSLTSLNKTSTTQTSSGVTAPNSTNSVTTPPNSTSATPSYASAAASSPQDGSPYNPGTLLNVSA